MKRYHSHDELIQAITDTSKANPGRWYYIEPHFGYVTIASKPHAPRTDCPGTIATFVQFGGFYKNGKIVKPGSAWMKRYTYIPCRDY